MLCSVSLQRDKEPGSRHSSGLGEEERRPAWEGGQQARVREAGDGLMPSHTSDHIITPFLMSYPKPPITAPPSLLPSILPTLALPNPKPKAKPKNPAPSGRALPLHGPAKRGTHAKMIAWSSKRHGGCVWDVCTPPKNKHGRRMRVGAALGVLEDTEQSRFSWGCQQGLCVLHVVQEKTLYSSGMGDFGVGEMRGRDRVNSPAWQHHPGVNRLPLFLQSSAPLTLQCSLLPVQWMCAER